MSTVATTHPMSSGGALQTPLRVTLPSAALTTNAKESSAKPKAHRAAASKQQPKMKRRTWKKPKDKPKRPLSAYNLFFQHERANILASTAVPVTPPDSPRSGTDAAPARRRRKAGQPSGVGFAGLARNIAQKWKNLDAESRTRFEAEAAVEKKRYKEEMEAWTRKKKLLVELNAATDVLTATKTAQQGTNKLEQQQENRRPVGVGASMPIGRTTIAQLRTSEQQRHQEHWQKVSQSAAAAQREAIAAVAPVLSSSAAFPLVSKQLHMPMLPNFNQLPPIMDGCWNGTISAPMVAQPDRVLSQQQNSLIAGNPRNAPFLEPLDISGTGTDYDFGDLLSLVEFEGV